MLRIPVPQAERFVDPAVMRRQMLDETFTRIGDTLDIEQVASELLGALVPHFCNAADLLLLESLVGDDELPTDGPEGSVPLRRIALRHAEPRLGGRLPDRGDPALPGEYALLQLHGHGQARARSHHQQEPGGRDRPGVAAQAGGQAAVRRLDADAPAGGPGHHTGLLRLHQAGGVPPVRRLRHRDRDGLRPRPPGRQQPLRPERATTVALQRSVCPTGLSPSSVEVRHRYLPGNKLIEVGGDWYESIALPGGRVALVVGDVAGHGVRAAVTMGRLRTAIHTLAMLELPQAESLQQLDELMHTLGEREPHFATCAYAVYDAVSGDCEVAIAGHLPPLLVHPDGSNELLDVPPAPPLGIGDGEVNSRQFKIEDGSLFILYTDGLVENKGQDISDGLARRAASSAPGHRPAHWRTCARPPWTGCTPITSATTSRC